MEEVLDVLIMLSMPRLTSVRAMPSARRADRLIGNAALMADLMMGDMISVRKKREIFECVVASVVIDMVDVKSIRDRAVRVGPDAPMEALPIPLEVSPAEIVSAAPILLDRVRYD